MSTRGFPSPRLATAVAILGTALAYGTVAAMGACSSPADPAGVHVVVTMSSADWDDQHAFDHLTVTAHVGERRAVGCLYPSDVERAWKFDEEPGPTSCADHMTEQKHPWKGPPTAAGWAFDTGPPTVNVEAAEGEYVEIDVVGGFGGRIGTVRGRGVKHASSAFPELRVELTAGEPLPAGCEAHLEPVLSDKLYKPWNICEAADCPDAGAPEFRSRAVLCFDGGPTRVRNGPEFKCPNKSEDAPGVVVWYKDPQTTECAHVFTTGRFARCLQGDPSDPDCVLTAHCTPPPTGLAVRQLDGGTKTWESFDVSCLPPTGVPITWSVTLPGPADKEPYGVLQDVDAAADPESCFLDVFHIAVKHFDCGAP